MRRKHVLRVVRMFCWARAWRVPRGTVGASSPRSSAVPVTFSSSRSSGQGNADPRPLPLSYNLLDGDATLPAIVLLHGLFGSKTNFNSLAKALVQRTGRRVSFRVGRRTGGRGLRGKSEDWGPSFNLSGLSSC